MHDFNCFSQSILNGIKLCKELKDSKTLEQNINTALQYNQDSIKHFDKILKINKDNIENYLKIKSEDITPNSTEIQNYFKKLYETINKIKQKKESLEITIRNIIAKKAEQESIDNLNTFKSMPQNISIGNYQLTKKSIHIRSTKNIDGTNKRRLSNQQLIPTYEFTDKDGKIHEIREDKNKTWRRLSVIDLGAKTSIRKCKSRRIWNINKNYI